MKAGPLTLDEKTTLAQGAIAYADSVISSMGFGELKHKTCALQAWLCAGFFQSMGIPATIAAGSASWQMLTLEQSGDLMLEGKEYYDRFGYIFNEDGDYMAYVMAGELPEVHCWVYLPITDELFDPTVGYQHAQMLDCCGPVNEGVPNPLPQWLWGTAGTISKQYNHYYIYDRVASVLIGNLLTANMSSLLSGMSDTGNTLHHHENNSHA